MTSDDKTWAELCRPPSAVGDGIKHSISGREISGGRKRMAEDKEILADIRRKKRFRKKQRPADEAAE